MRWGDEGGLVKGCFHYEESVFNTSLSEFSPSHVTLSCYSKTSSEPHVTIQPWMKWGVLPCSLHGRARGERHPVLGTAHRGLGVELGATKRSVLRTMVQWATPNRSEIVPPLSGVFKKKVRPTLLVVCSAVFSPSALLTRP